MSNIWYITRQELLGGKPRKEKRMEYELRKTHGNKAIGFNIAQNGIFVFLWWVEFALVWKASRPGS